MIIGINTLSVLPGIGGGSETYLVNLLNHLSEIDQNNTYYIFVNNENHELFPQTNNFTRIFSFGSKNKLFLRILWEQLFLPFYVKQFKIDLLFSPANISPIILFSCKSLLTIHDVYWANFSEHFSKFEYLLIKYLIILSATRANKIIAVSEYGKNEIQKHIKIKTEKVKVIYEGVRDTANSRVDDSKYESFFVNIGSNFLLSIGRTHEHKNFLRLIEAFKLIKQKNPAFIHKLVIAGIPGRYHQKLIEKIKAYNLESEIFVTGRVDNDLLILLYKMADLFIFPSIYEGFGLPILEAMSFGVPVVAAKMSALPEIGGKAAFYFNPFDISDIAAKILIVLNSKDMQKQMIEKGYKRIKNFSWLDTAKNTLKTFEEVYKRE